jgi:hypothetical protein
MNKNSGKLKSQNRFVRNGELAQLAVEYFKEKASGSIMLAHRWAKDEFLHDFIRSSVGRALKDKEFPAPFVNRSDESAGKINAGMLALSFIEALPCEAYISVGHKDFYDFSAEKSECVRELNDRLKRGEEISISYRDEQPPTKDHAFYHEYRLLLQDGELVARLDAVCYQNESVKTKRKPSAKLAHSVQQSDEGVKNH